ncbi:MAG TPA: hypothetical protein DCP31_07645 [Cyanobacteria bacterium UBA8543]|nr:hypothetical protein [Cyanobacteria bacterium UBA8543]
MLKGLCLTSVATLLVSLYLLIPTEFYPKLEFPLVNNISLQQIVIDSNDQGSQGLDKIAQASSGFFPQDNGGPDYTRGSGTR